MIIENEKVVSLTYSLNVEGALVDQGTEQNPLVFLYGVGQMIPGFERQLAGLKSGEDYNFMVTANEGYGIANPEEVVELSKDIFIVDGKIVDELKQGATMHMQDQDGHPLRGLVVEMKSDTVIMDFNHPLAGKELNFSGKILDIRPASADEIAHGHVHGEGGHHH